MKPSQVPFQLVCYWEELLEKYSSCYEEDREKDEPVLMFQRNAFLKKSEETNIKDPKLLYLLYHETRRGVHNGR